MIKTELEKQIIYFRKKLLEWAELNFQDFPWRYTKNEWHALTAEVMLQRTKAEQVVPVYIQFCSKYKNPSDYLSNKNENIFESLGLRWRNKEFIKLARILVNQEIPEKKEELLRLPCIGHYISAAFRSLHLGARDVIIDSNVVRIYGRYFGFKTDGETRRKKWLIELADRMTPLKKFKDFNYGLIDFTKTVCKPKPVCKNCRIKIRCEYYSKNFLNK